MVDGQFVEERWVKMYDVLSHDHLPVDAQGPSPPPHPVSWSGAPLCISVGDGLGSLG